jgi:uncharacterized protein (UPF0335 family)
MKKILLTTAIVLSTATATAGFNPASHNWNDSSSMKAKPVAKVVNNTMIANSYNRNNSVSTADIAKIGSNKLGYTSILATVKAEQKKAQKAGFEWNTIRKLMKAAKKDQKAGNESAAIKKLNKAIIHAKLGQQQAIDQKNAGPRF